MVKLWATLGPFAIRSEITSQGLQPQWDMPGVSGLSSFRLAWQKSQSCFVPRSREVLLTLNQGSQSWNSSSWKPESLLDWLSWAKENIPGFLPLSWLVQSILCGDLLCWTFSLHFLWMHLNGHSLAFIECCGYARCATMLVDFLTIVLCPSILLVVASPSLLLLIRE